MSLPTPTRARVVVVVACAAAGLVGAAAPAPASAAPNSVRVTGAWLEQAGGSMSTLTVIGAYTCTDPVGTTLVFDTFSTQLFPFVLVSGSATVPCGPGVVDAPWSAVSYPDPYLHSGFVNINVIAPPGTTTTGGGFSV